MQPSSFFSFRLPSPAVEMVTDRSEVGGDQFQDPSEVWEMGLLIDQEGEGEGHEGYDDLEMNVDVDVGPQVPKQVRFQEKPLEVTTRVPSSHAEKSFQEKLDTLMSIIYDDYNHIHVNVLIPIEKSTEYTNPIVIFFQTFYKLYNPESSKNKRLTEAQYLERLKSHLSTLFPDNFLFHGLLFYAFVCLELTSPAAQRKGPEARAFECYAIVYFSEFFKQLSGPEASSKIALCEDILKLMMDLRTSLIEYYATEKNEFPKIFLQAMASYWSAVNKYWEITSVQEMRRAPSTTAYKSEPILESDNLPEALRTVKRDISNLIEEENCAPDIVLTLLSVPGRDSIGIRSIEEILAQVEQGGAVEVDLLTKAIAFHTLAALLDASKERQKLNDQFLDIEMINLRASELYAIRYYGEYCLQNVSTLKTSPDKIKCILNLMKKMINQARMFYIGFGSERIPQEYYKAMQIYLKVINCYEACFNIGMSHIELNGERLFVPCFVSNLYQKGYPKELMDNVIRIARAIESGNATVYSKYKTFLFKPGRECQPNESICYTVLAQYIYNIELSNLDKEIADIKSVFDVRDLNSLCDRLEKYKVQILANYASCFDWPVYSSNAEYLNAFVQMVEVFLDHRSAVYCDDAMRSIKKEYSRLNKMLTLIRDNESLHLQLRELKMSIENQGFGTSSAAVNPTFFPK